jgi:hypothetical protein
VSPSNEEVGNLRYTELAENRENNLPVSEVSEREEVMGGGVCMLVAGFAWALYFSLGNVSRSELPSLPNRQYPSH